MAPDLNTILTRLASEGAYARIAGNELAQFGRQPRMYLGANLLPERNVDENMYREDSIRYRTVIANDGTRYSPSQKKAGDIVGSMLVELGHSDIAREMDGREYDILLRYLGRNADMEAMASITNWLDTTVNLALVELLEKQRWEAIVEAEVIRQGDNTYEETVSYSNPTNHRVSASAAWSNDATDPFDDIFTQADLLVGKGFQVTRIITSRQVMSILGKNAIVRNRVGVQTYGSDVAVGRATRDAMNAVLETDGLPPIETYDLQYRTQSGTGYFLPRDVMVLLGTTGRDETFDLGDDEQMVMADVLGYTAIGRAAGQSGPGRVIRAEAFEDKPPRIEAEGWQAALPVITSPEAIAVIHTIT
jgi:hypothetical protein